MILTGQQWPHVVAADGRQARSRGTVVGRVDPGQRRKRRVPVYATAIRRYVSLLAPDSPIPQGNHRFKLGAPDFCGQKPARRKRVDPNATLGKESKRKKKYEQQKKNTVLQLTHLPGY